MKISVSLPDEDVEFLDTQGGNRSALLHEAVDLLRHRNLAAQYDAAFAEFAQDQTAAWDTTVGDGLSA